MYSKAQRQEKDQGLDADVGLELAINQLAMAKSVHWYGHVMRRENSHVITKALDIKLKGQMWKKWINALLSKKDVSWSLIV